MSQYKQLNEKQKEIVDIILNKIDNNKNCCYFIDGLGGSSKTFVYTTICHLTKFRNKRVLWLSQVLQLRCCLLEKQYIKHWITSFIIF